MQSTLGKGRKERDKVYGVPGKAQGCIGEVSGAVLGAEMVVVSLPKNRVPTGETELQKKEQSCRVLYPASLAHGVMVVTWRDQERGLGVER
jgi:hypothetical protein